MQQVLLQKMHNRLDTTKQEMSELPSRLRSNGATQQDIGEHVERNSVQVPNLPLTVQVHRFRFALDEMSRENLLRLPTCWLRQVWHGVWRSTNSLAA